MKASNRFDWTSTFSLVPEPYYVEDTPDHVELTIPVSGVKKSDITIERNIHGYKNTLSIGIPDTILSEGRTLSFSVADKFNLKGTKANVRDGMLYVRIPRSEKSKPSRIEIT